MTIQLKQVIRYGFVGLTTNLLGYLIYLLVTWVWLEPKMAVTVLYPVGVTMSYFGHARYSFSYQGRHLSAVSRFIVAHLIGYLVNLSLLYIFVDGFQIPHQFVQASAIFVVAGVLFLLFRYFVFPDQSQRTAEDVGGS